MDIDEEGGKAEEGGEEVFPGGNPGNGFDMEGMDGKEAGAEEAPPLSPVAVRRKAKKRRLVARWRMTFVQW